MTVDGGAGGRAGFVAAWRRAPVMFALALLVISMVGGCAAGPSPSELAQQRARQHIIASVNAIRNGDFETARIEVQRARMRSPDHRTTGQARNLERLINGARAMEQGDVAEAKRQWEAIEDPLLAREVRRSASEIGIELSIPRAAAASEVQP